MNTITDLLTRKGDVASKLERAEQELSRKQDELGGAILAGGDVDRLISEVEKLEAKVKALRDAARLADRLQAETEQADGFQAAAAELASIDAELHQAALDAVKRLYAAVDELERLQALYTVAEGHYRHGKHADRLNGSGISQSWGVLGSLLGALKPIRRQIEFANPAIVEEVGEQRRF